MDFGSKTGIDLAGEGTGIMFKMDRVGPVEAATTAFGQGVSVTPIQQVTAVSAAVNGGILYTPYIAKELIDSTTGKVVMKNYHMRKEGLFPRKHRRKFVERLNQLWLKEAEEEHLLRTIVSEGKQVRHKKRKMDDILKIIILFPLSALLQQINLKSLFMWLLITRKELYNLVGLLLLQLSVKSWKILLHVMGVKPRKNQIEKEKKWNDPVMIEVPECYWNDEKRSPNPVN